MAEAKGKPIYASLLAVQRDLKAPKGQFNSFGKYKYRSCEDIVEAVKPLLNENGLILTMSDDVVEIGNYSYKKDGDETIEINSRRVYIKATATVIDVVTGDKIEVSALAREPEEKKGMDSSQITGTASSYARKYALNGLFAIDDTKDADTDAYNTQTTQKEKNPPAEDKVRKQCLAKLTAEMKRLNLSKADTSRISKEKLGKASTNDMSDTEICVLTENLEGWVNELNVASTWAEDQGVPNL